MSKTEEEAISMAIASLEKNVSVKRILSWLEEENMFKVDLANMTMDAYVDGQVSGLEYAIDIIREKLQ